MFWLLTPTGFHKINYGCYLCVLSSHRITMSTSIVHDPCLLSLVIGVVYVSIASPWTFSHIKITNCHLKDRAGAGLVRREVTKNSRASIAPPDIGTEMQHFRTNRLHLFSHYNWCCKVQGMCTFPIRHLGLACCYNGTFSDCGVSTGMIG